MKIRKVCITEKEAIAELSQLNKHFLAFDTETNQLQYAGIQMEGISFADQNRNIYIPFSFKKGQKIYWNNEYTDRIITYLQQSFFPEVKLLIGHNIVFDLKVLHAHNIHTTAELYDTMIADHLIDERNEHGLKKVAARMLGVETSSYSESAEDTGSKKFFDYALYDADWTFEIALKQRAQLQNMGLYNLFKYIEMPFQRVLLEMQVNGIDVDMKKHKDMYEDIKKQSFELEKQMYDELDEDYQIQTSLTGDRSIVAELNLSSSTQMADVLFNRLGLPIIETTPGGKPSVGKKTMSVLKKQSPFVQLYNKHKILQKLQSAFFDPLPSFVQADGKIRPSFHDHGTRTGRLSSSNPNIQQLPKPNKDLPIPTRSIFVAPEGYKMITCDYSGQELRVLAEVSQEYGLIDMFNKGKDLHLATANDFFDLGIEEQDLYEGSPNIERLKEEYKDERNKAKIVNFGIAYGKGAFGFSQDFGISEDEAQKILDKYFGRLPGVKRAIEQCHADVNKQGWVATKFGRRRNFEAKEVNQYKFYPKKAYRESFNFLIQGYSADMIRKAMVDVWAQKQLHPEWDLQTIATVHDEAVYIVKEPFVKEASQFIKKIFEDAVTLACPVVAECGIGGNYEDAK